MITPNKVQQHFNNHATRASNQVLNDEMGQRLLQRLQLININPDYILDIGCGDGRLTANLKQQFPKATLIGLDASEATLRQTRPKRQLWRAPQYESICTDACQLPIASESCQLVTANLLLPFCSDLTALLSEIQRVLTVEGVFIFNSLGPDSFEPLKQFWPHDYQNVFQNALVDMHDLGDELVRAQMTDPVMDVQELTIEYSQLLKAVKEMYWWGASPHLLTDRTTSWRAIYRELRQAYPQGVDVQLELVNGHAWKPQQTFNTQTGEVNVSIESLRSKR